MEKNWLVCREIFGFFSATMGNLRPVNLFCVALLKPMKYHYSIQKSTKSVESVSILALDTQWEIGWIKFKNVILSDFFFAFYSIVNAPTKKKLQQETPCYLPVFRYLPSK